MATGKLNVVLCWHMHQPWYRHGLDGDYLLPWVYLHATKDYSDMAAHLEQNPSMKAVVNFAPVLLEQIDDYALQMTRFLERGDVMQDKLLNLLAGAQAIPSDVAGREQLIVECQRCEAPRMIEPYPPFNELIQGVGAIAFAEQQEPLKLKTSYLSEQYFIDLLVWYHLCWLGQSLRNNPGVQRLMAKGRDYTLDDRLELLGVMQSCVSGIIPRYRALAESGQVELSMTPYMHPIVPLLHDFSSMRDALPDAPAPDAANYPGGHERARWHMQKGLDIFQRYFGLRPKGVWLSEGAVSESALQLLDDYDIDWTASGEGVWRNSCDLSGYHGEAIDTKRDLFVPHQLHEKGVRLFFRDDGLSDMIGFKYSHLHAAEAAEDFVSHLTNIAQFLGDDAENRVVSVILDGENAWEYYPENGNDFLDAFYKAMSSAESLNIRHFSDTKDDVSAKHLDRLAAGSWVYGSFSTWIGDTDKNRGWDYLVAAKQAYDENVATLDDTQREKATRQLAVCEGSDWFWWFGDDNPAESVSDFEQLYRQQLGNLYELLGLSAPAYLDEPISKGGGKAENAGTMRRNAA